MSPSAVQPAHDPNAISAAARGLLTVDLAGIQANWRWLAAVARGAECAGVVKADAYGMGIEPVAKALWTADCRTFFVATLHISDYVSYRDVFHAGETLAPIAGAR